MNLNRIYTFFINNVALFLKTTQYYMKANSNSFINGRKRDII